MSPNWFSIKLNQTQVFTNQTRVDKWIPQIASFDQVQVKQHSCFKSLLYSLFELSDMSVVIIKGYACNQSCHQFKRFVLNITSVIVTTSADAVPNQSFHLQFKCMEYVWQDVGRSECRWQDGSQRIRHCDVSHKAQVERFWVTINVTYDASPVFGLECSCAIGWQ